MKKLTQMVIILAIASLEIQTVSAHHAAHYKTLWEAYKKEDLKSAKVLFSKDCWRTKKGDISGEKLSELLSRASQIDRRVVYEDSGAGNCILGMQFYVKGEDKPKRYWLLSEPIHDKRNGNIDPLKYRVKTITTSNKLAASHINRPLKYPLTFGKFPLRDTEEGADAKCE